MSFYAGQDKGRWVVFRIMNVPYRDVVVWYVESKREAEIAAIIMNFTREDE